MDRHQFFGVYGGFIYITTAIVCLFGVTLKAVRCESETLGLA